MIRIVTVDKNRFKDVPDSCRYCLYWQRTGPFGEEMLKPEMEKKKLEWFNRVTTEFGKCVKIAYLNNVPTGFIHYAPARSFPRATEYSSGPPSQDAILIACLYITSPRARGKGLGARMLKNLIEELRRRGFEAVETFARKSSENNPSGPLALYLKHNFKVKSENGDFPLVRLEL